MWWNRLSMFLALAWMALLFLLSHQPALPTPQLFAHQDKLFHAVAYGVLGALLLAAQRAPASGYRRQQVLLGTAIASLYGISDEFHQYFIPGRQTDVLDWLADTLGALTAASLLACLSARTNSASPEAADQR